MKTTEDFKETFMYGHTESPSTKKVREKKEQNRSELIHKFAPQRPSTSRIPSMLLESHQVSSFSKGIRMISQRPKDCANIFGSTVDKEHVKQPPYSAVSSKRTETIKQLHSSFNIKESLGQPYTHVWQDCKPVSDSKEFMTRKHTESASTVVSHKVHVKGNIACYNNKPMYMC